ncbi:unnamed protein product [Parascedosporium putredinis]|uniref:Uncharacterized protein n=1 Tax=Parascedosporium putredinis TaxID=1442378 RepID=A0A9P1H5U6_9PEZI|nr:unnamed protein product [Parascedosporium putredinis]CAI7998268.1 unnamed protein product [Parascedosporium putredinis]
MSDKLDRSLDELLDERKSTNRGRRGGGGNGGGGNNSGGGSNRPNRRQDRDRQDSYPRDGVRKVRFDVSAPIASLSFDYWAR